MLCLVFFFHSSVDNVALTCSGSSMLHRSESLFSFLMAVSMVDSALPSFLSWKA
jgi:hypothetical protein